MLGDPHHFDGDPNPHQAYQNGENSCDSGSATLVQSSSQDLVVTCLGYFGHVLEDGQGVQLEVHRFLLETKKYLFRPVLWIRIGSDP
jgi:hypothetical protein